MYKTYIIIFLLVVSILADFKDKPITHVLFMPTGYTLEQSEFIFGFAPIEFGITNRLQIGTDMLLGFIQNYYNIRTKMVLYKSPKMSLAAGIEFGYGGDDGFLKVSPLMAYSRTINPKVDVHFAYQYRWSNGYRRGTEGKWVNDRMAYIYAGISYHLSKIFKLLAETGYDFAIKGYHVSTGALFTWDELQIKVGIGYYVPSIDHTAIGYPYGFWWRFK